MACAQTRTLATLMAAPLHAYYMHTHISIARKGRCYCQSPLCICLQVHVKTAVTVTISPPQHAHMTTVSIITTIFTTIIFSTFATMSTGATSTSTSTTFSVSTPTFRNNAEHLNVTTMSMSVPLVGYPQRYGERGSTLASTSVVLHGNKKSAGVLLKGIFSPGWPVGALCCWLR